MNEFGSGVLKALGAKFPGSIGQMHLPDKWKRIHEEIEKVEKEARQNPANWVKYG